jgi:hypothetical protein
MLNLMEFKHKESAAAVRGNVFALVDYGNKLCENTHPLQSYNFFHLN